MNPVEMSREAYTTLYKTQLSSVPMSAMGGTDIQRPQSTVGRSDCRRSLPGPTFVTSNGLCARPGASRHPLAFFAQSSADALSKGGAA